jgi:cobalamin biosynthesis Mg chelatase CobN
MGVLMAGNRWMWRGLLVVLLVAATAFVLPVAAQNAAPTTPLTWTLPPTPDETPEETQVGSLDNETPEETQVGSPDNETPEETQVETTNDTISMTTNDTTNDTTNETAMETGPPIIVGTDEVTMEATPAETSTVEMPTFTPIQAAQVNPSPTASAPLSLISIIAAVAIAGLLVVLLRNRR